MSVADDHIVLAVLAQKPLLADGAMGTLLFGRGVQCASGFESLNINNKAAIEAVHLEYLRAGADIIRTNTFAANSRALALHGLADKVWEINVQGAKIARAARDIAGRLAFIAGSMGPLDLGANTCQQVTPEMVALFREQAEGLLAGGVDIFWIETATEVCQAIAALQAVRGVARLPVALQFSFGPDGLSAFGQSPAEVAGALRAAGIWPDIFGVNCGAGPTHALASLAALRKAAPEHKLWSFLPNAGLPLRVSGRPVFTSTPAYLAGMMPQIMADKVSIVGGCCGTDPLHIFALRQALDTYLQGKSPVEEGSAFEAPLPAGSSITRFGTISLPAEVAYPSATPPAAATLATPPAPTGAGQVSSGATLRDMLGKEFCISVEMDPPKGANVARFLAGADSLRQAGVDAINVADSPMARVRMDATAASHLIQLHVGTQAITHMTTRDRNLMGLQSNLLGAHALGIRSILALTGDPPALGNSSRSTGVYDVDSIGLIQIAIALNNGCDMNGNPTGDPTDFLIGCALSPNHPDLELELKRLRQKVAAGAQFIMTQPIYDREPLDIVLNELGGAPVPLLLGVMPLHSYKHAHYLHNEVPGIDIPEPIRNALQKAGDDGLRVGCELTMELIETVHSKVAGVYIVPSFGKYAATTPLVEQVRKMAATSVVR